MFGSPPPTKRKPSPKQSEAKDASGDVSNPQLAVFDLFVGVLTLPSRNHQKSESEMSILIDDEPPKRRRKGKGEKDESVRVASRSSR